MGFGKVCIPKPTDAADVEFHFAVTERDGQVFTMDLGCDSGYACVGAASGTYVFTELVSENPLGWVLRDIVCQRLSGDGQSWWKIEGASVTIYHDQADVVVCYFTNGPSAVGGYIEPVSQLTIVGPYLALVGVIAATTVIAVALWKKLDRN